MAYLGSTGRADDSADTDSGRATRGSRSTRSGGAASTVSSGSARGASRGSSRGASRGVSRGTADGGDGGMEPGTAAVSPPSPSPRAAGRPYTEERDWKRLATFGGGIALGALLGAGVALLLAPATGEETRELLLDHARSAGGRVRERFDDLRDDVRYATRRGRRGMHRGLARGGWALEDALDRARRFRS
jgi:hypothetical protein